MGVLSYPSNFFGNVAAQQDRTVAIDDKLERAILKSQRKDAVIVRHALSAALGWLTASEARPGDAMANAKLACQRRDAAIVWHTLGS
tara:strand:+ start:1825 stop:2085 length:261 start_codon:yes stop_codon:yes gene_type:complete